MLTENRVLMENAWQSLTGRWKDPVVVTLLYVVITAALNAIPVAGSFAAMIIGGPLMLGFAIFILGWLDKRPGTGIETLFKGFDQFVNAFVASLLVMIFTLLWTLLLIIPGIMAAYKYAMTFFILAENPGMSGQKAIELSKQMMMGHRWRLFCLHLRFIGWWLLGLLTLGILWLWIGPYFYTTNAMFYRDLLAQKDGERPIPANAPEMLAGFYGVAPAANPSQQPGPAGGQPPAQSMDQWSPHSVAQAWQTPAQPAAPAPAPAPAPVDTNPDARFMPPGMAESPTPKYVDFNSDAPVDPGLPSSSEPLNPYVEPSKDPLA